MQRKFKTKKQTFWTKKPIRRKKAEKSGRAVLCRCKMCQPGGEIPCINTFTIAGAGKAACADACV